MPGVSPIFEWDKSTWSCNVYAFELATLASCKSNNSFQLPTKTEVSWANFNTYKIIFDRQPFLNRVSSQNRSPIMAPDGVYRPGTEWTLTNAGNCMHTARTSLVSVSVCFLLPWYILIVLRTYMHKQFFLNKYFALWKKLWEGGSIPHIAGMFAFCFIDIIWLCYEVTC